MKFVFFSVSDNGKNGLGDEGADGAILPPQNFWARTAPGVTSLVYRSFVIARLHDKIESHKARLTGRLDVVEHC